MNAEDANLRTELEERLRFETLIADLSSRFVNLPAGEVDREIEDALRRVCELLGVDLAVLWQWLGATPGVIVPTHAYCTHQDLRPSEPMRQDQYPWAVQQMLAGRMFVLSSLEEYPAEATVDKETCRRFGIKAGVCIPLLVGGEPPVGALGLSVLRAERNWPEALVKRLQLVAQILANALARKRGEEALRISEARLAGGVDIAGLGFVAVDESTGTVFADDRLRELIGVPPDWEQGMRIVGFWKEHLHPDDVSRVLRERQEALDGKREDLNIEYRYLHPVRGEIWIQHIGRPTTRDDRGFAVKSFSVLRDITERRLAENQIHQLSLAVEQSPVSVVITDLQGNIIYVNRKFTEVSGYSFAECIGQNPRILKSGECPASTYQQLWTQITSGGTWRGEFHNRKKNGELYWEWAVISPLLDSAGKVTHFVGVKEDITETKRAEAALRASEELNRATFEQAAVGIAHVGTDGRWLRVNDRLCAIVGYPREELLQLTFQDITHPDDLETDLDFVRQVLSGEIKSYSMEKRYLRKDRSLVWVILTVSLVRTVTSTPLHFISVVEDITERKRSEVTLRDLSGRLINAQEQERARLARELHDGLSQNLALQAVQLELMAQRPPTAAAELASRLQELSAQTKKLSTDVHRISHDLHPAKLTQLGLTAAVAELCHDCLSVHRIPISFEHSGIPRSLPLGVALCLYRVAQECIQNMIKHSGAKQAGVQLTLVKNEIHLCVADDGCGFDVEAAQTTSSLGLVSMRERVRLVGGEIRIESKPGQGTRITVRTPVPEKAKP